MFYSFVFDDCYWRQKSSSLNVVQYNTTVGLLLFTTNLYCLTGKFNQPLSLMFNVVYKFNCLRDADLSYIDRTTCHSNVTVREHLHSKVRLAVGKHVDNCHVCKEKPVGVNDFKIRRACSTEYNTKNQEDLLIKKCSPKLNSQLHANGSSISLSVFNPFFRFFVLSICFTLLIYFQRCVMVI